MENYLIREYENIKKTGYHPLPGIIAIEPTYKCNLSCSMCFNKKQHYFKKELLAKDFIKFLKGIPKLTSVYFPAREPLFKNDFFEISAYLSRRKIPMVLLTNGTLINKKNYHKLIYNKNNIIMTSLDGHKDLHNKIRGSIYAFDKTVEAIKLLKGKCNIHVVSVISEDNLSNLWELPGIVKELGLRKILFEYERKYTKEDINNSLKMMKIKTGFSDLKISKTNMPKYSLNELKSNIKKIENESRKYKIKDEYLPFYFKKEMTSIYQRKLREKYKCTCLYLNKARIDPEGNYVHCFAFRKSFGNILNSSLEEVWFSPEYKEFRKNLLNNNLMPICETCWGMMPIGFKSKIKFK